MAEKTSHGFTVYARIPLALGGTVRVQESSSIGEGPRVWLFLDDAECYEHLGRHERPAPHLTMFEAIEVRDALSAFIRDAERVPLVDAECGCAVVWDPIANRHVSRYCDAHRPPPGPPVMGGRRG